jgi:hypothetical protein
VNFGEKSMTVRGRTIICTSIGLAILLLVGYFVWKSEQAMTWIGGFINRAPVESVTTSVGETVVMRTAGGTLEVARIKAYENLRRTDPGLKMAWGLIDMGTTVSEIDVATLFRYHIDMAKEWPVRCVRGTCVVRAGRIQPTLPPAIYSDEMRKRTESGWARFNKNENLAALEKSMTSELEKRATTERNMRAATEAGRRTVAEFVKTWMLKSTLKPGEPVPKVVVLFPGETMEAVAGND